MLNQIQLNLPLGEHVFPPSGFCYDIDILHTSIMSNLWVIERDSNPFGPKNVALAAKMKFKV